MPHGLSRSSLVPLTTSGAEVDVSADLIRVLELRSVRGTGGGPEKTILLGAARADRNRFAVTVCYIRDRRDPVFDLGSRAVGLGIDYVEVEERHSFDTRVWSQLTRLIRHRRIGIVHSHEYKTDALALLLGRSTGIRPIATAHGWTGQSLRERWCYYPADKAVLARFPRVVAVSGEIRDDLIRHGAQAQRIDVILNSIDGDAFRRRPEARQASRKALGYDDGDVVIGAVGRLERQKRFDLLVEAFAVVAPRYPALKLAIAGDGSLRQKLSEMTTQLGLANRCSWLGHRSDVVDLHHAFDLFVQSSEYEGTPNAVLEAMAMETPIVATDAGGTREVARPGVHALVVPIRDVPALAAGIAAVLDNPAEAKVRVDAARKRVDDDLTFEARTRHLESIYVELAAEREPKRRTMTGAREAGRA
jgi:glycosyltransferase involved in cell wall biosynthesis